MLLITAEVALSTARVPEYRVGRQTRDPCCVLQGPAGSSGGVGEMQFAQVARSRTLQQPSCPLGPRGT